MITSIPVLQDMNGYFDIAIYESTSEGYFKRTSKHPFHGMIGLVYAVSTPMGTIECKPRTNAPQKWRSPTVLCTEEHYPKSAYQFFRDTINRHQLYIATANDNSAIANRLQLHKFIFRPGASTSTRKLFMNKYSDAMNLWGASRTGGSRYKGKAH
ncbi:MAG: hypothetical protein HKN88_02825 [Gammaproteobacteria bacterium]|nr:hypothetical protein [Gammaproteobacteria bacterium]NNC96986.1 hypothetical protein [Gammaproteobacteria bacterium]NNM13431.1 hypothetical protein [Gammaproteobacteria bacterium]